MTQYLDFSLISVYKMFKMKVLEKVPVTLFTMCLKVLDFLSKVLDFLPKVLDFLPKLLDFLPKVLDFLPKVLQGDSSVFVLSRTGHFGYGQFHENGPQNTKN